MSTSQPDHKIFGIISNFTFLVSIVSSYYSLDRHKVYETQARTASQLNFIETLPQYGFDCIYYAKPNQTANFLVEPDQQNIFTNILQQRSIRYKILIENVTEYLISNNIIHQLSFEGNASTKFEFDRYYRAADIVSYLSYIEKKFPDRVILRKHGYSFEGRQINSVLITDDDRDLNKRVIFVEAGMHAREWLSPAIALFIIYQLTTNAGHNWQVLEEFNWVVLPLSNPDGYEYSHTMDRKWRKNRSVRKHKCKGVDINRNFAIHWSEIGSSNDPCSEMYHGLAAFSEVEARIIKSILLSLTETAEFFLSLHSYGPFILYPYGYTSHLPRNWQKLDAVAKAGADAIRNIVGKIYKYGSTAQLVSVASGRCDDFAFDVAKIPISMTVEMEGRHYGFDPPPYEINHFAEESWITIKAMVTFKPASVASWKLQMLHSGVFVVCTYVILF